MDLLDSKQGATLPLLMDGCRQGIVCRVEVSGNAHFVSVNLGRPGLSVEDALLRVSRINQQATTKRYGWMAVEKEGFLLVYLAARGARAGRARAGQGRPGEGGFLKDMGCML